MTAVKAPRTYYPALDGLRGVAILLVIFYHNFGFIKQSFFGWLGVDLFFVLSGFLITGILLRTVNQPAFLQKFYMRRVLRIFPLYYLSLVFFFFILPLFANSINFDYYRENQVYFWTYLQNWLFIFREPGNAQLLNHYWSLAVEEQFYIFWPLVILLLKKPKRIFVFITFVLLMVVLFRLGLWVYHIENLAYYNLYTFTRIDGICIGCMVALLLNINPGFIHKYTTWIVLFFAAINFGFFFINQLYNFSFPFLALVGYTTFAMIFGILVYESARGETPVLDKLFSFSPLKFFGRISYGLYIIHWPVYLLLQHYINTHKTFPANLSSPLAISIMATVIAIFLSWISYNYFEKYFLRLKENYAAKYAVTP